MGCSAVVCLLFGLTRLAADPTRLEVPADKTKAAAALVTRWEDESGAVRDQAMADLKAMGREALPALVAGANGKPSAAVKERLPAALAVARAADFEARYPLFLADKDGWFEHDFLGWTELKAVVKDTPDSRLLFRDILEDINCRDMLLFAIDPSKEACKKCEQRWGLKLDSWYRARPLNKGEPRPGETIEWLAAALLTDLIYNREYRAEWRTHMFMLYTTCTDEGIQLRSVEGRHGNAVIDLARVWVERQEGEWGKKHAETLVKDLNLHDEDRRVHVEKEFDYMAKNLVDTKRGALRNLA